MKLIVVALFALLANAQGPMKDRIDLPPAERQFNSVSGNYICTLKTLDAWKTPKAWATLRLVSTGAVLWQRELPHHHGPRRVLVTNAGQVVLVDEWINVLSLQAVMLIAPDGVTTSQYQAEQILNLLAVPRKKVTDAARVGPWMSEEPMLSPDGKEVRFRAGGRSLRLRLEDGRLLAWN